MVFFFKDNHSRLNNSVLLGVLKNTKQWTLRGLLSGNCTFCLELVMGGKNRRAREHCSQKMLLNSCRKFV
jgi:hypothetical protein